jgi:Na+/H+ antiporter NhaD/arsenite permease-like protein
MRRTVKKIRRIIRRILMEKAAMIAVIVFLAVYVLIISEKIHRAVVSLAGVVIIIVLGVLTQEEAIHGIDFNTIGLLIGMMIIVGITRKSGVFEYIAMRLKFLKEIL